MTWLYMVCKRIVAVPLLTLFRVQVHGRENIPASGGLVLASNHASGLDVLFIGSTFPDPIHYLTKSELFNTRFGKWFFTATGQIKVDRHNPGGRSIAAGLQALQDGGVIGMFPEGTVTLTGQLLRPKTGTIRLALGARVPILPVSLAGTFRVLPWPRKIPRLYQVAVRFGQPYTLEEYYAAEPDAATLRRLSDDLMTRIAALKRLDDLRLGYVDTSEVAEAQAPDFRASRRRTPHQDPDQPGP